MSDLKKQEAISGNGFLRKELLWQNPAGFILCFFRKPISNFGSYDSLVNFVLHVL